MRSVAECDAKGSERAGQREGWVAGLGPGVSPAVPGGVRVRKGTGVGDAGSRRAAGTGVLPVESSVAGLSPSVKVVRSGMPGESESMLVPRSGRAV